MRSHLADIHSYFFLEKSGPENVYPISRIDCEIIEALISIQQRLGNGHLCNILEKWKSTADRNILSDLEALLMSDDLDQLMKESSGDMFKELFEKMKRMYIEIGGNSLHTNKIFVITRNESHDGERPVFNILINDEKLLPPGTSSWYCNIEEVFYTREDRDAKHEEIKGILIKNTMCKFLN